MHHTLPFCLSTFAVKHKGVGLCTGSAPFSIPAQYSPTSKIVLVHWLCAGHPTSELPANFIPWRVSWRATNVARGCRLACARRGTREVGVRW